MITRYTHVRNTELILYHEMCVSGRNGFLKRMVIGAETCRVH
jgi:hypothetical protein